MEILLYKALDEETSGYLIQCLDWIGQDQVYTVRMYCPGGDVAGSWGIPAKMNELKARGCRSIAKVDGMAASMAGVLLCYFDEREALDVSQIMLHRAAYPEMDENGKKITISPQEKALLASMNTDLLAKLSQVINSEKLKELKGYSLEDLFDEKKDRINCWLTPSEALQIGLITKIVPVDANNSKNIAKAAAICYDPTQKLKATAATAGNKNKKMTTEEFKKENPEAFLEIQNAAVAEAERTFKAKAKAAIDGKTECDMKCGDCPMTDGCKKKSTAKDEVDMPTAIAQGVELALKKMGLAMVDGSPVIQTAAQTAEAKAKLEKEEADKKTAEAKTVDALKAELETIKTGK